jgi:hypothetical protein
MLPKVEQFLKLRLLLRDVQEEDGWLFAKLDFSPEGVMAELLRDLQTQGVVSEIRRNGTLVFPSSLGPPGPLDLRIDTGNLPGYFESYQSLVRTHPDSRPVEFMVWNKSEALEAGYVAACELLDFLKSKAEVWDATGQRLFLVDQQALEIPLTSYSATQTPALPAKLAEVTRFLDKAHLGR